MKIFRPFVSALLVSCLLSLSSMAQEPTSLPANATDADLNAYNAGCQLINANKGAEAAEKFRLVLKSLPNFGPAHSGLGAALVKQGKTAEGIVELQKAATLSPNDANNFVYLGQAYQLAGRSADALETYKKYLEKFPKSPLAPQVGMMLKTLQFEVDRMKGVSSKGLDNYLKESLTAGGGKWMAMPVRVYIGPGDGVEGYKPEFVEILKAAFKEWSDATAGKLQFAFVENSADSGINCRWTANPKDLVNPLEGGQALAAQDLQGKIVRVEMLILTKSPQIPGGLTDKFVRHVCLHEIGHALGLAGHSSQPGDIMFSAASIDAATGVMSARDKKTISLLYENAASVLQLKQ